MEIKVLHQVMDWNEDVSEEVKGTLAEHHICMVNVMGSPGAGTRSASLLSACPPSSSTRTGPATSRP